jgi:hypothetical protein
MSLSAAQLEEFRDNGLIVVRNFYDVETMIRPIQRGIHAVIGLVIEKHKLPISQKPFSPETFDSGYLELIKVNRRFGGQVYDAVKQIPAFMRLVGEPRHETLMKQLRNTDLPGIAAVGYGIRIDNPGEEKFMAKWHQEYLGQLRSLDGVTFWIPLHDIDQTMGAVEFGVGSHKEGLFKVRQFDPENPEQKGAYALRLADEEALVSRFKIAQPSTLAGDLVVIDFLVLHRSGFNASQRTRWSMQTRYFNFREPTGMRIGWAGSYAAGVDPAKMHPEVYVDLDEEHHG